MSKYVLSERDYRRFQELLRWYERNKRPKPPQLRRRGKTGGGGGGGASVHKAYCKADAGTGTTIVCYLDTDLIGDEITVDCDISNGIDLNAATRRLKLGDRLMVVNIAGTWYSNEGFQKTKVCP